MKRILVPTDFSPTAEKAFRFALEIAARAKSTIILYHLFTPISSGVVYSENTKENYNNQLESDLLKRLRRLKKKVTANSESVPVLTIVGRMPIINNILGFAEHNNIDIIVMGTQGASGLKKVIIGSVSSRVIKKSDVPVLLVPEKFEWKIPEQIIFASDCRKTDLQVIPVVYSFAKIFKTGVNVVHIFSASKKDNGYEKARNEFDNYSYSIKKTFANYKLKFQLIKSGSLTETMKELDHKLPHDVLIMVRGDNKLYKNLFSKSLTQSMAFVSKKPLLIIPEEIDTNLSKLEIDVKDNQKHLDLEVRKIKQKKIKN